jgi:hypothetical protein
MYVQAVVNALPQIVGSGAYGRQCASYALEILLAGRAHAHAAGAAFEEANPKMGFQSRDLMADRGRRQM